MIDSRNSQVLDWLLIKQNFSQVCTILRGSWGDVVKNK